MPAARPSAFRRGIMGNSEVGHINIGVGPRRCRKGIVVIDAADRRRIVRRPTRRSRSVLAHVQRARRHAALLRAALRRQGPQLAGSSRSAHRRGRRRRRADRDRRVSRRPRRAAARRAEVYIDRLEAYLASARPAPARFASIGGRYYAMDRDKRWERVEKAYALLARGSRAHQPPTASEALEAAYARDENDEFVCPTIVGERAAGRRRRRGDLLQLPARPRRARLTTGVFSDPAFSAIPGHATSRT